MVRMLGSLDWIRGSGWFVLCSAWRVVICVLDEGVRGLVPMASDGRGGPLRTPTESSSTMRLPPPINLGMGLL